VGWIRGTETSRNLERKQEEIGQLSRRIAILDDRLERERTELARVMQAIGPAGSGDQTLAARVERMEGTLDRLPGAPERLRLTWHVAQAEYYLRLATAQASLAGDAGAALTALQLADDSLRDAAEPRLGPVRRVLAEELTAIRALPRADREGIALRLEAVAARLPELPRRQGMPERFRGHDAPAAGNTDGGSRVWAALRDALLRVVSVRRTEAPATTAMSDEGAAVLLRSQQLELEIARVALLRGEPENYRASVKSVAGSLQGYYDTSAPPVTQTIATLNELAAAPLPRKLPDLSPALAELVRIKERQLGP
jgi:uroporphyrin-3 C-methyltransferase